MTPAQCRAARGLLDWTQERLSQAAATETSTIAEFERSNGAGSAGVAERLRRAFENAGLEFTNGAAPGVRVAGQASTDQAIPPDELTTGNDV